VFVSDNEQVQKVRYVLNLLFTVLQQFSDLLTFGISKWSMATDILQHWICSCTMHTYHTFSSFT